MYADDDVLYVAGRKRQKMAKERAGMAKVSSSSSLPCIRFCLVLQAGLSTCGT